MALGPGILIAGRYVIEKKIGEGSWGEVWLGHHARVGMRVAVKALRASKVASHDAVVRFGREANFLGRIQSDYVARVLDYLEDDVHGLILVMEFVHGDSLQDLVGSAPLGVERAVEIGCDIAAGLCDLHAARIVHRDLKPANIILRPLPGGRTRAVIIDFSLGRLVARPGDAESSLTQLTGAFMSVGTLPYMSPEQVLDSRKVTFASDVYALGALLYRSVMEQYVFPDADDTVVAKRKLREAAPALQTGRDDDVATGLARVVARALRRRPEERYVSAADLLAELLELREAARAHSVVARAPKPPIEGPSPAASESTEKVASPVEPPPPPRSRAASLAAGAGLLLLGVGIGLVGARVRPGDVHVAPVAPVAASGKAEEEKEAQAKAEAQAGANAEGELVAGAQADEHAPVPPPTSWSEATASASSTAPPQPLPPMPAAAPLPSPTAPLPALAPPPAPTPAPSPSPLPSPSPSPASPPLPPPSAPPPRPPTVAAPSTAPITPY